MKKRSKRYSLYGDFSIAIALGALIGFGYFCFNLKSTLEDIAEIQNHPRAIEQ